MDDEELARCLEEGDDVTHDHHVKIQKECSALQAVKISLEGGELGPASLGYAWWQRQARDGQATHLFTHAPVVVGEADEVERAAKVARHHGVEAVHVLRPVLGPPLHAQHDALAAVLAHQSSSIVWGGKVSHPRQPGHCQK